MVEIWAVLDGEAEVNETFTVTLTNPTGGARLGDQLQTFVTVLENLAPAGLFRIMPSINRSQKYSTVKINNHARSHMLIQRCFITYKDVLFFLFFSTEMTLTYLRLKVTEQSSSQCLAVMVWVQPSVWNGRHSLTQLLHLVRPLHSLFSSV